GFSFRREFEAGATPSFSLLQKSGTLGDGQYAYELTYAPVLSKGTKEQLAAARKAGNEAATIKELKRGGLLPSQSLIQSGSFAIQNGVIYIGNETEPTERRSPLTKTFTPQTV